MKSVKSVYVYGAVATGLALTLATLLFHWSWVEPVSMLCTFAILMAARLTESKLAPKHPLAAKIAPELVLVVLVIWSVKARICGDKSYLWFEICAAVIFLSVVWKVITHFRYRHILALQNEEQEHAEFRD